MSQQQECLSLVGVVGSLLGRAIAACAASDAGEGQELQGTVLLELEQLTEPRSELIVRVCDDGTALPTDERALARLAAALIPRISTPCFESSALLLRSTSPEEPVIRLYRLHLPGSGAPPGLLALPPEAKPPGRALTLNGSQCSLVLQLRADGQGNGGEGGSGGDSNGERASNGEWDGPAADAAVSCLEQLLGMLRVLAPPVKLTMRLRNVALQSPLGTPRPVSGSKRLDLQLGPSLSPLARLAAGLVDEFGPVAADPAGTPSADGNDGTAEGHTEGPLFQTFVGVGQAGWGCEAQGAAVFRGSKWVARAGVVLRVPDHAAHAARQQQAATQAARAVGEAVGAAEVTGQDSQAAPVEALQQQQDQQQAARGPASTPLYLFHSHVLQLGAGTQEAALRALERVDWGCFGFKHQGAAASATGPASLLLCCAQPASGAWVEALVVHLQPGNAAAEAAALRAPPLTAASGGRAARGAVEAALRQLKTQCPTVVASRRERCLLRALPTLARAVGSIVQRSTTVDDEGSSLQAQACAMLDCGPEAFLDTLHSLLHQVANNAGVDGETDEGGGGGGRRRRRYEDDEGY